MANDASKPPPIPVFRVDKFIVPTDALPAFIERMQHIQQSVRALPGCRRDLLLTQTGGAGEFNVLRWIEWTDVQAIADAQAVMQKQFAEEGFDPTAFFVQKLGARADMGLYREV